MIYIILGNIKKKKARTLLTILGIMVAIQLYVMMASIMNNFDKDTKKQVDSMAGKIMVQQKSDDGIVFPPINSNIQQNDAQKLLKINGININESSSIVFSPIVKSIAPNSPPTVLAVGIEQGKEKAYIGNTVVEGVSKISSENDVILGNGAAKYYKVKLNESVKISGKEFKVVGILNEVNKVMDGTFLIDINISKQIFVKSTIVNSVYLTAENPEKVNDIAKDIQSKFSNLSAATSEQISKSANDLLKSERVFLGMIDTTALAIAIIVIMIVMIMGVFEKKKDIGTLKAIGASNEQILSLVLLEGVILSFLGGIFALPMSILGNGLILKQYTLDPVIFLKTMFLAVIIGIIGSLIPARYALKLSPLDSLEYE